MLGALDGLQSDGLAVGARQPQRDLLCRLRLLVEDRLGLTAETLLLLIVTTLTLGERRRLARLVLGNL